MATASPTPLRLASVSFVNSLLLNYGLDRDSTFTLKLAVPSALLAMLQSGDADVALLPTIDYQKLPGARVLAATGIACEGPTLTVRLFARQPIERITTLACDADSHTSVALSQIILAERFGVRPRLIPLAQASDDPAEARLLIGDKVILSEPFGFPHQYDLGEEWNRLTGLPFVFAIWTVRAGVNTNGLANRLKRAKSDGRAALDSLIRQIAIPRGWPAALAHRYLTKYLRFDIGPRELDAIQRFHRYADQYGLIPRPPQPFVVANG